jgi:hypothetical protein
VGSGFGIAKIDRGGSPQTPRSYLEAALTGWRVLRLTELQITTPMIGRIVSFVRTAGVKLV